MTLQALLNDITEWQAAAGVLIRRRAALLGRARKLKALGAVRDLLAVPRVGEPESATAPEAYPGAPMVEALETTDTLPTAHQEGPLAIPANMRKR